MVAGAARLSMPGRRSPTRPTTRSFWDRAAGDPARIWELRRVLRARLVAEARRRLRASWRQRGASEAELIWIDSVLDDDVLTIGFARRVPSYKRLTMMLHDPARLTALLLDPDRPVQIVVAGKAHPADDGGKQLIQQLVRFADHPQVRHRIVFLPDYDMAMARTLVQGCDVWLNNPLRPLEACGTSGMKAALNGGLNLSVLDGWWDEWFDGQNGWAIPSADGVPDPARRDEVEAAALYDLIGKSVAPLFYDTSAGGLAGPAGWRWCRTRCEASARGRWRPGWSGSTSPSCTRPAAARPRGRWLRGPSRPAAGAAAGGRRPSTARASWRPGSSG